MTPLFRRTLAKLAELPIVDRYLTDEEDGKVKVYGALEGNTIYVNSALCVAEVLIHEALHAVNREYDEATVERLTTKLVLHDCSHEEIRAVHDIYLAKCR